MGDLYLAIGLKIGSESSLSDRVKKIEDYFSGKGSRSHEVSPRGLAALLSVSKPSLLNAERMGTGQNGGPIQYYLSRVNYKGHSYHCETNAPECFVVDP